MEGFALDSKRKQHSDSSYVDVVAAVGFAGDDADSGVDSG